MPALLTLHEHAAQPNEHNSPQEQLGLGTEDGIRPRQRDPNGVFAANDLTTVSDSKILLSTIAHPR